MFYRLRFAAVAAAACLLIGCADPGVSGTVKIKGTPLASGTIKFIPSDGSGEFSTEIHNGEFAIAKPDMKAGDYKVAVEVQFLDSAHAADFYAAAASAGPGERPPEKKDDTKKSYEFTEQLKGGANTLTYDINE